VDVPEITRSGNASSPSNRDTNERRGDRERPSCQACWNVS
jgi:hypothetical protein